MRNIGKSAFYNCQSVQAINIPEGVTTIEENSFQGCAAAKTLKLPATLKLIKGYAFSGLDALTTLVIPAAVDSIGTGAFCNMVALKTLKIEDSQSTLKFANGQDYGAHGMFSYEHQPALENVYIGRSWTVSGNGLFRSDVSVKKLTVGGEAVTIPAESFYGCTSIEALTLGEKVRNIGKSAFYNCQSVQAISIPKGVTTIEESSFQGCAAAKTLKLPATLKLIKGYAFSDLDALSELVIPAAVDSIGTGAFCNMKTLKTLKIEDSKTTLKFANGQNYGAHGMFSYEHQPALEEAYIGRNWTVSGNGLFRGHTALVNLTFGTKVDKIPAESFYDCNGLEEIHARPITPPVCTGGNVFKNVNKVTTYLYVPTASVDLYKAAPVWMDFYDNIRGEDVADADLNGDGSVNVGDVTTLVNMILGKTPMSPYADLNGDGSVNVGDVTTLVNMILGK